MEGAAPQSAKGPKGAAPWDAGETEERERERAVEGVRTTIMKKMMRRMGMIEHDES